MEFHLAVLPHFGQNFMLKDDSVECAVLIPDLTRHYDVVEIISAKFFVSIFLLPMETMSQ